MEELLRETCGETGVKLCQSLTDMEKELDWKISRKQTQITDAAFKTVKLRRTLRVLVSHRVENQEFVDTPEEALNPPSWILKIEGKLEPGWKHWRKIHKPLSYFLKSLVVEIGNGEGEDTVASTEVVVKEWKKVSTTPETDGFEIHQRGSTSVPIKIHLGMDYQPDKYNLSEELARVIELEQATRPQVVLALWQYIKRHKLQESEERKVVNNDQILQKLFGVDKMTFAEIPARLEQHLTPTEPVLLEYFLDIKKAESVVMWDLEVEIEDEAKMRAPSANIYAQQREINALDQRIMEVTRSLKASIKYEKILRSFASDPAECLRKLLSAQCGDAVTAAGEPPITVNDLRNTSKFDSAEIARAISILVTRR